MSNRARVVRGARSRFAPPRDYQCTRTGQGGRWEWRTGTSEILSGQCFKVAPPSMRTDRGQQEVSRRPHRGWEAHLHRFPRAVGRRLGPRASDGCRVSGLGDVGGKKDWRAVAGRQLPGVCGACFPEASHRRSVKRQQSSLRFRGRAPSGRSDGNYQTNGRSVQWKRLSVDCRPP